MNLETLLSLTTYAFVTSITPGPNNAMLFASGVNFGLRRTLPHILGVSLGYVFMQLALGLGVGLAFAAWPPLFTVLRLAGSAYMLYLAWRIANSTPPPAPVPAVGTTVQEGRVADGPVPEGSRVAAPEATPVFGGAARPSAARTTAVREAPSRSSSERARPMTFLQATAFQWVNPKAVMMCIGAASAFTPQDHPVLGVLVICAVFLVVNFPCVGAWAALGTAMRGLLQDRARLRVFNVAMALLLVASLAPMLGDLTRELGADRVLARLF
jgi:threonine/homoserine/homoserine lactone efflux protein